jgi:putative nucleotidyltransferase with HDIG domain
VGGDEFAVIVNDGSASDALEATQRLQTLLASETIGVTVGIGDGIAPKPIERIIHEADMALIAGKRSRQAVTVFSAEVGPTIADPQAARGSERINSLTSALALAVDAKDPYTRSHSQAVSQFCALLATELALGPALITQTRVAGLLHDVGKIGITDAILTKSTELTDRESDQMERHAILGAEIVAAAGLTIEARWIRHHHEHYDGRGYPEGLIGEAIPLQSRIILVADAFEAMTSDRPYGPALGQSFALAELTRQAGTQFDPRIVQALCAALGPARTEPDAHHPDLSPTRIPS